MNHMLSDSDAGRALLRAWTGMISRTLRADGRLSGALARPTPADQRKDLAPGHRQGYVVDGIDRLGVAVEGGQKKAVTASP